MQKSLQCRDCRPCWPIGGHSRPCYILCAPAVPFVNFPVGHNRAGNVEGTVCDPFLGSPSTCPRARGVRAQTMENSEKGLRAEVTTNYLRLTDAAIRAATLPPGKSQHYLHDAIPSWPPPIGSGGPPPIGAGGPPAFAGPPPMGPGGAPHVGLDGPVPRSGPGAVPRADLSGPAGFRAGGRGSRCIAELQPLRRIRVRPWRVAIWLSRSLCRRGLCCGSLFWRRLRPRVLFRMRLLLRLQAVQAPSGLRLAITNSGRTDGMLRKLRWLS